MKFIIKSVIVAGLLIGATLVLAAPREWSWSVKAEDGFEVRPYPNLTQREARDRCGTNIDGHGLVVWVGKLYTSHNICR